MKTEICKECKTTVHPLEVFPGPRCLGCHARAFDQMTPAEMESQIMSGFSTNALNTKGQK